MECRPGWDTDGDGSVDAGDQYLSAYSEEQNNLHSAFISKHGKEANRSVVFLFKSEVAGNNVNAGAKLGDMLSEACLLGAQRTERHSPNKSR